MCGSKVGSKSGPFNGIDKEIKERFPTFYKVRFFQKLGLDEEITSWELRNQIPRQRLPIWSSS